MAASDIKKVVLAYSGRLDTSVILKITAACGQLGSESIAQRASQSMADMRSSELAQMPS